MIETLMEHNEKGAAGRRNNVCQRYNEHPHAVFHMSILIIKIQFKHTHAWNEKKHVRRSYCCARKQIIIYAARQHSIERDVHAVHGRKRIEANKKWKDTRSNFCT